MKIQDALAQLRSAAEALAAEHPDLAADEAAFVDTLDGLTDGLDLLDRLGERVLHLQAMEFAACERAKSLQARAKRFEAGQERLKLLILALVEATGGKKITRPGITFSPRNLPPKVVPADEAQTPPEFLQTVTKQIPDKRKIAEALEMGAVVDGWYRTNGGRTVALLVR